MDSGPNLNSDGRQEKRSIITSDLSDSDGGVLAISGPSPKENESFGNRDAAAGPSNRIESRSKASEDGSGADRRGSTCVYEFDADATREEKGSLDKQTSKSLNPLADYIDFSAKNPQLRDNDPHEATNYIGYYFRDNAWQRRSSSTPLDTPLGDSCDKAPEETECTDCHHPDGDPASSQRPSRQLGISSSPDAVNIESAQIDGAPLSKPLKRASQGESQWSDNSESIPHRSRRQTLRDSIGAIIRGRSSLPELWRRMSPDRSMARAPIVDPKHEPRDNPRWPDDEEDGQFCDALVGLMQRREQVAMDEQHLGRDNSHSV